MNNSIKWTDDLVEEYVVFVQNELRNSQLAGKVIIEEFKKIKNQKYYEVLVYLDTRDDKKYYRTEDGRFLELSPFAHPNAADMTIAEHTPFYNNEVIKEVKRLRDNSVFKVEEPVQVSKFETALFKFIIEKFYQKENRLFVKAKGTWMDFDFSDIEHI